MTTPQTVAGAIRARLIDVFPELQVFRNEAPDGTETPVVVITDGLNVQGEDLGDDLLLTEQVQVDLYIDYAQVTNWADQIHAALHRAPISIPGSQIHRCLVTERVNQPADAGNEDGVERITFTVLVRRRMSATEYGTLPIQPTPTQLEVHEAKTTNVHGIANTAELETQTGAQAKADNALAAANAYTDAAIEEINVPDLSLYETIVGAQAKADAAEADAIAASNAYTDQEVIDLTNGTTDFESAQFNTAAGVAAGVGELTWNDTDGTLDLGLKGGNVTLQIGQENVQMTHNGSGTALVDGQAVYVQGAQGNRLSVNLALANNDANSARTFGVVTEPIGANQNGFVTYSGLVRNINTSAFPEGAALWLSPTVPGGITHIKPAAPDHLVLIGWCVRSHAQVGSIFVHVQNGYEIGELHDVLTNGVTDGQVLTYDSVTGLWKPEDLPASISPAEKGQPNGVATLDGSGTIPASQLPPIAITNSFPVTSQAAMLALVAQTGDIAIRSDLNKSFVLSAEPASTLGNWLELLTPTDAVLAVEGRTGSVSLADLYAARKDSLIDSSTAAAIPLTITTVTGQTSNALLVRKPTGFVLFSVSADGDLRAGAGLRIGSAVTYSANKKHISIENTTAVPVGTPTAGAVVYVDGGRLYVNDDRGNKAVAVTTDTVAPSRIEQASAATGNVLTWSGTEWAPAVPTGGGVSNFQGVWSATKTFAIGDTCIHNGQTYIATAPSTNSIPANTLEGGYKADALTRSPVVYAEFDDEPGVTILKNSGSHTATAITMQGGGFLSGTPLFGTNENASIAMASSRFPYIPHNATLANLPVTGFTVEFIARIGSTVSGGSGLVSYYGTGVGGGFLIWTSGNFVQVAVIKNGAFPFYTSSLATVGDGLTHHYSMVWDGTSVRLYIDGIQRAVGTPASGYQPPTLGNLAVKRLADSLGTADSFNGRMSHLATYPTAFSAATVASRAALWQQATPNTGWAIY